MKAGILPDCLYLAFPRLVLIERGGGLKMRKLSVMDRFPRRSGENYIKTAAR